MLRNRREYSTCTTVFLLRPRPRAHSRPAQHHRRRTMKLGVAVNAFDGHELLRAGLIAIRAQVDYVCVVYQTGAARGTLAGAAGVT